MKTSIIKSNNVIQCRVLLVEDNPAAAMAARLALERLNCMVDVADNGTQALEHRFSRS